MLIKEKGSESMKKTENLDTEFCATFFKGKTWKGKVFSKWLSEQVENYLEKYINSHILI